MQRDPLTKRLVPDSKKFPNGIKSVADKIHAMGLKFGIYRYTLNATSPYHFLMIVFSDAGFATCEKYPGSLGYESIDAETFSEWGVDCKCLYHFFRGIYLTTRTDLKYGRPVRIRCVPSETNVAA